MYYHFRLGSKLFNENMTELYPENPNTPCLYSSKSVVHLQKQGYHQPFFLIHILIAWLTLTKGTKVTMVIWAMWAASRSHTTPQHSLQTYRNN